MQNFWKKGETMSKPKNPGVQRVRKHQKHRETVMRTAHGICHLCGVGGADAIDHIVPVAWGGSDEPRNLAPAHTSCNSQKGAGAPEQWTYGHPDMWIPGFGPNGAPIDPAVFVVLAKKAKRRAVAYTVLTAVFFTWFVVWTVFANNGNTTGPLLIAIVFGVLALKWNMRMWRNRDNAALSTDVVPVVSMFDDWICHECGSDEVTGLDSEERYWCEDCIKSDLWLSLNGY